MNEKLNWKNLEKGLCPRCRSVLEQKQPGYPLMCPKPAGKCGFLISEKRCKEILSGLH